MEEEKFTPILFNLPHLKARRKALRKRLTVAEQLLWERVKENKLGIRIRRQQSIGNFIVDFYCARRWLVIELDGGYHNDPEVALYDEYREKWLTDKGFTVMRFPNEAVYDDPDQVAEEIRKAIFD